jgi:hypothetical protein
MKVGRDSARNEVTDAAPVEQPTYPKGAILSTRGCAGHVSTVRTPRRIRTTVQTGRAAGAASGRRSPDRAARRAPAVGQRSGAHPAIDVGSGSPRDYTGEAQSAL